MTATARAVASQTASQSALPQTGAEPAQTTTSWLGGLGLFLAGLLGRRKKQKDDKK
ncbi:LPXTG cell wall anchor domain-containing protein [Limosilactobacillus ingluviei]